MKKGVKSESVCRRPWVFSMIFSEKCEGYFFNDVDNTFMRVVTCAWEKSAAAEWQDRDISSVCLLTIVGSGNCQTLGNKETSVLWSWYLRVPRLECVRFTSTSFVQLFYALTRTGHMILVEWLSNFHGLHDLSSITHHFMQLVLFQ
jgi:hypothetical protein